MTFVGDHTLAAVEMGAAETRHHANHAVLMAIGVILIVLAVVLLWAGTVGADWSNTHNRLFRKVPHYGRKQTRYNNWACRLGGVVALTLGVVIFVVR